MSVIPDHVCGICYHPFDQCSHCSHKVPKPARAAAMSKKACDGGRVLEDGDFAECWECGTRVRWDLRDDAFWGFQHCPDKARTVAAVDPHAGSMGKLSTRD